MQDTCIYTFIEDIYWFEANRNLLGINLIDWLNLYSRNEFNVWQFMRTKILTHALRPIMFHVIRVIIQFLSKPCSLFFLRLFFFLSFPILWLCTCICEQYRHCTELVLLHIFTVIPLYWVCFLHILNHNSVK